MNKATYSTKVGDAEVYRQGDELVFDYQGRKETVSIPGEEESVESFVDEFRGALDGKAEEWMR